ncbi:GDSL-type esterase/lipase family protein [Stella sp.]|uniref:GDSL-type esterase/lipase family protein n=1 Tax=Stella sp. TaxID=2912054 RepID=UPI0035B1FA6A
MIGSKVPAPAVRTALAAMAVLVGLGGCGSGRSAPIQAPAAPATAGMPGPCGSSRPDPLRVEPPGAARPAVERPMASRGQPLAPFHEALARLDRREAAEPVAIVILGDSHMAANYFSGRLRERLQARFGSAGPGAMPGRPTQRAYRNPLAEVQQTGSWTGVNSLRATTPGPFGLSLYRLRADEPGAALVATASEPAGFERLTAGFVRTPGGGGIRVLADDCPLGTVATGGEGGVAGLVADLPRGTTRVAIEATDGPAELIGWRLVRRRGLVVDSHGVNGAQLSMLANLDPELVAAELRQRDPALVILAFGTNEAFSPDLPESRFRAVIDERVAALRRAVPRAAILLVGPPDSAISSRTAPLRGRRPAGCRWKEPPNLAMVKTVLRQEATRLGVAYWDWSRLTRGPCGVDAMTRANPPLAQADRVHFTAEGYAAAADQLARFLIDGYARRRKVS